MKKAIGSWAGESRLGRARTSGIEDLGKRRQKPSRALLCRQAERGALRRGAAATQRPDPGHPSRARGASGRAEPAVRLGRQVRGGAGILQEWTSSDSGPRPPTSSAASLVEELLESVAMYPDHVEVTVSGARRLNVTLHEVGLTGGGSLVVSEGGFEPPRPIRPLGPQPSASTKFRHSDGSPAILAIRPERSG
jgi:hypothetical protein